jgi:CMP-N,N'-diacetyllegionaminic acid synthase
VAEVVSVLGLVPARGGSRRIERKNLVELGGKSLVRRALETCLQCQRLDAVALSSEDAEILAEADGLDAVIRVERPAELATDTARSFDVILHALGAAEEQQGRRFGGVATVQCTSPFTAPEDVDGAIEMLERTGAGSVVTVARVTDLAHPLKLKRLEGDRLLPFLEDDKMLPSHELPELWARNGSVYVSRRETLEAGEILSDDVRGYVMPPERSHDVNGPLDLAFARFLLERGE